MELNEIVARTGARGAGIWISSDRDESHIVIGVGLVNASNVTHDLDISEARDLIEALERAIQYMEDRH